MARFFSAQILLHPFHPESHMPAHRTLSVAELIAQNPTAYEKRQRDFAAIHAAAAQPCTRPAPAPQPIRQDPVKAALLKQASAVEKLKRIARHHASTAFADIDRAYWQGRYEALREVRDLLESAVCDDTPHADVNGRNTTAKYD